MAVSRKLKPNKKMLVFNFFNFLIFNSIAADLNTGTYTTSIAGKGKTPASQRQESKTDKKHKEKTPENTGRRDRVKTQTIEQTRGLAWRRGSDGMRPYLKGGTRRRPPVRRGWPYVSSAHAWHSARSRLLLTNRHDGSSRLSKHNEIF